MFSLERGLISFHYLENCAPRTTEGITYAKPSRWKTYLKEKKIRPVERHGNKNRV